MNSFIKYILFFMCFISTSYGEVLFQGKSTDFRIEDGRTCFPGITQMRIYFKNMLVFDNTNSSFCKPGEQDLKNLLISATLDNLDIVFDVEILKSAKSEYDDAFKIVTNADSVESADSTVKISELLERIQKLEDRVLILEKK